MKDVLDVYARPYDLNHLVVCMDENPYQLQEHSRPCIEATPGRTRKEDYEYSRQGECTIFVRVGPLTGTHRGNARPRRTRVDWAQEIDTLLTIDYPDAPRQVPHPHW